MAVYLRKERERRRLSQSAVARLIRSDRHLVANVEAGRRHLTGPQCIALDDDWGTIFRHLRTFAAKISTDEDWIKQLWDFEKNALTIKTYVHGLVPVPLQTEGYARELLHRMRVVQDVDAALAERKARTELLLSQLPRLQLWVLLDEGALAPPLGDGLRRQQLEALLDWSEQVSLRVIPADEWHIGHSGSYELITTTAGLDVGYMWAQLGGKLIHEGAEVRDLGLRWDRMGAVALTESATRELIKQQLEIK
ncbi:DUF5753 domain-containing protein [Actinomadura rupiterrae]|uniref:DUF5753 domain-containing protein n=1 Tax=Actinomadura rupiterrae TaxID=559627 RepID=UPI0020A3D9B0|nr:DUF5753 domain-containing protein [Actinomadura rupiterrae]MCP2343151.1 transcriptional regulator with XRE-family HTH domain [Actinomadura rupiterrae]